MDVGTLSAKACFRFRRAVNGVLSPLVRALSRTTSSFHSCGGAWTEREIPHSCGERTYLFKRNEHDRCPFRYFGDHNVAHVVVQWRLAVARVSAALYTPA